MSKNCEYRTYDIDGHGNFVIEYGYWLDEHQYDYRGDSSGSQRKWIVVKDPLECQSSPSPPSSSSSSSSASSSSSSNPNELQSLGTDYETNGPSGAPKVLAFIHSNSNGISLSFYVLIQSRVPVSRGNKYDGSSIGGTVISWNYVGLFDYVLLSGADDDAAIKTRFLRREIQIAATTKGTTNFDVETFFYNNQTTKSNVLGIVFGIIAFDKGPEITFEELKKYGNNRDGRTRTWIVPVKLSNPRCIYVDKKNQSEIPRYLTYQEEKALSIDYVNKRRQIEPEHAKLTNQNESLKKQNIDLQAKITQIETDRKSKIEKRRWFNKATKIANYIASSDYTTADNLLKQYREELTKNQKTIEENDNKMRAMVSELQSIADSINRQPKPPTIYFGSNHNFDMKPTFFINPDFSPSSLVRLVHDFVRPESRGGRKNKSRKSKKSIKIKKRYIQTRKYTNKNRRRSYRH